MYITDTHMVNRLAAHPFGIRGLLAGFLLPVSCRLSAPSSDCPEWSSRAIRSRIPDSRTSLAPGPLHGPCKWLGLTYDGGGFHFKESGKVWTCEDACKTCDKGVGPQGSRYIMVDQKERNTSEEMGGIDLDSLNRSFCKTCVYLVFQIF